MSKMVNLRKKLDDVVEDIHRVSVLRGSMGSYPKYDQHYSSAQIANWDHDLEKLHKREEEIRGDIAALQVDPGFVAEQEGKLNTLAGRRNALTAQFDKAKAEYDHKRNGEADAVLSGVDPLQLAIEIFELRQTCDRIIEAISIVNSAVRSVEQLSVLQFSSRAGVALIDDDASKVGQGELTWPG